MISYIVDIFEPGAKAPVVTHVFNGETREEAKGYYESHMKTDDFLNAAIKQGKWKDISLKVKTRWVKNGVSDD